MFGWYKRCDRHVWPSQCVEIEQDRLRVLDLRGPDLDFARRGNLSRGRHGKCGYVLAGEPRFRFEQQGWLAQLEYRHHNGVLDRFDPEGRRHLQRLGVGLGGQRLGAVAQQESNVVGTTSECRRSGNDGRRCWLSRDGYRGGFNDRLLADLILEQRIWIIKHRLRKSAGGNE